MTQNRPQKPKENEEIPSRHWADSVADELITLHGGAKSFTCASGISPSGVVHIGNFREVITVDFVVRALRERGKTVRFIYSWDDYDALRKVPKNLPNPEEIEKHLRKPLAIAPDPFGCCESYASHFEKLFETEIAQLGIFPEYIYQNKRYRSGHYAKGIAEAYANEKQIAGILNKSRTEALPDNWSCLSLFCKDCQRDTTEIREALGSSAFKYFCKACKKEGVLEATKDGNVKLLWRVDWPMRWAAEKVDFEPGGKDHSSTGGSYDTGKEIIREIWKREPPFYVQYDFVLAKGMGSKLSSSSGNLITLSEALEIYEPAVLRWVFASRKPNLDFSIAFDLDVMKAYDDFDRNERFAYGVEPGEERKVVWERRIYELACVKAEINRTYGKLPAQFPFRHLCNLLQIQEGNIEKVMAYYGSLDSEETQRFQSRAVRAWKWITTYAPEEFKFHLKEQPEHKSGYPEVVKEVANLLRSLPDGFQDEDGLAQQTYNIVKQKGIEPKVFFQDVYRILVSKPNGPKLASFFLAIGPKRAADILLRAV